MLDSEGWSSSFHYHCSEIGILYWIDTLKGYMLYLMSNTSEILNAHLYEDPKTGHVVKGGILFAILRGTGICFVCDILPDIVLDLTERMRVL